MPVDIKSQNRHINYLADAVVGVQACATAATLRGSGEEAKSVGGQKLGVWGREGGGGGRGGEGGGGTQWIMYATYC